jgi:glycosyltransferase involved in cell wall biosynthesis
LNKPLSKTSRSTDSAFVGRYTRYPDLTGKRATEGGKRLRGELAKSRTDEPLVTIITVCWNSARTIEQTIRSVLEQTYRNIEYLVIDGASTDGTLDILRKYDAEIDYYLSEPDEGLYFAMNKGLELARGDYILILNSDDWYVNDAVEALVAAAQYSGCDFVSGMERHVHPNEKTTGLTPVMHFDHSIYFRASIHHETMLVPSKLYNELGLLNTVYRVVADIDLMIRLFEAGATHYKLRKEIIFYRQTGISSTDAYATNRDMLELMKNSFPFLEPQEIVLLSDRPCWTGHDLIELADRYFNETKLVDAIHDYMLDHTDRALRGRGLHRHWKPYAKQLIDSIHKQKVNRSPALSVIMPVYNAEKTVAISIDSVLQQTYGNFELICVNDASTDLSQTIIDQYVSRDLRIRSIINEANLGPGGARNRGVRSANGSYVFFIDPDDTIPEDAFEIMLGYAKEHGSELVRGAYFRVQSHGASGYKPKVIYPLGEPKTIINSTFREMPNLLASPEGHWAYLYRSDVLRRAPYPEDLGIGEDGLFLHLIVPSAATITVIPDVVYHYLENPNSAMNKFVFEKYANALEWRLRASRLLNDFGFEEISERLKQTIPQLRWHDRFIEYFKSNPDYALVQMIGRLLRSIYGVQSRLPVLGSSIPEVRRKFISLLLEGRDQDAAKTIEPQVSPCAQARKAKVVLPPSVSVILPIYNAEATVRRSIESVLSQSLKDIELICINDRSPDDSQAIIDEYARKDPRIVPIMNEKNIGHGASRNVGIKSALGSYIFHLDPDDKLPPGALENILTLAKRYGSDMTRGAYWHEQLLLGQTDGRKTRKGRKKGAAHLVNTTLKQSPALLNHTEGHWAFLYKADFARRVKYPEDLKMGQDSIFLVNAMVLAQTISITDVLVYHYCANPNSAMNTFSFRKFMDALEWRIRAWRALCDAELPELGEQLLFRYWSAPFFLSLEEKLTHEEKQAFDEKFAEALRTASFSGSDASEDPEIRKYCETVLRTNLGGAKPRIPNALRVVTFSTQDYGGAGIGSMRRVEALRCHNVQAELHVLRQKSNECFVEQLPLKSSIVGDRTPEEIGAAWRKAALLNTKEHPGLKAHELFSKTGSVVDFGDIKPVVDAADVVHLHWVSGIFDYAHAEVLGDKPVVWTLADMNAFTGGCHYSEGCEHYREDCCECPLLGVGSDLAYKAWQKKRAAYAKIKNLHVICPSQWLADCARASSLFGDRPVHMIPNALPVDRFKPTNKLVARLRLGLPLDKKFVVFGADSLNNRRKGGDILVQSIRHLRDMSKAEGVEGLFFGSSSLDLGVKSHNMGHISDEVKLSLIYAAADVFAFPSREDNAPLTVAESLLSGTPVVAFPVGNVPELIRHKDTGFIAKYEDAKAFAEGLAWALAKPNSPEALSRGLRGCIAARKHNDPDIAVERHLRLYQEMLDSNPNRVRRR